MAVQQARDRRGRSARGRSGLLDRGAALTAIADTLESIGTDAGQALLLVGHAGMGKTRLHEAALDEARSRELRVLRAAGAELEQNLAFGVARQLLGALFGELSSSRRERLLATASRRVRELYLGEEPPAIPDDNEGLVITHGLFTLLATATENRRGLIAVDDLHWCDPASLSFVLYLLHRLAELPLALVVASRPADSEATREALDQISAHPRVHVHRLEPLRDAAVAAMVQRTLGDRTEPSLVETCRQATGGNPFYLHELLLALAEDTQGSSAELESRVRSLAPDTVTRSLRVRVGRLGTAAIALARAVAILGDDVPLRHAAALSGLSIPEASDAADALGSVEVLLSREPLRFVHPLIRHVIELDVPASERASRHLDAARLLYAEGEDAERVAAHLLVGRAQNDPWVVSQLRAAAHEATGRGSAESAARYLERALAEPPPAPEQSELLVELGAAEATLGSASAADRFAAAVRATPDPRRRAELELQRGRALRAQGAHLDALSAFESGLRELEAAERSADGQALHDELQSGFLSTAWLIPSRQAESIARAAVLRQRLVDVPQTYGQRLLLAELAMHAALTGEPSAQVAELARRAWAGGELLAREGARGIGWHLACTALSLAGELEPALEVADAALRDARDCGSPLAFATASSVRSLPELWRGQVAGAVADLEQARDARRFGWRLFVRSAAARLCLGLIETGELGRAEAVLTEDSPIRSPYDVEDAVRLYALAELRLAQGRPEEALVTAFTAGEAAEANVPYLGFYAWRTCAAQAALALGDRERSLALAAQAHRRAQQTRVLHQRIRTEYVLGLCEGGDAGLTRLRAAAHLGGDGPPRLETVKALLALGSALRRANERTLARDPLQRAADLAREGGASVLYEHARTELAATGARPRRDALLSGPESLTPSERRIAGLAAGGQSNREIAAALFVTPKTVEYHLRNTYRKLDIQTRRELASALAG
jgi:DNA-binding CsgD family transcriptional regulator